MTPTRPVAALAVAVLVISGGAARATDELPVRYTAATELRPVAGEGYLAWAQNSRVRPAHFDVFVRRGTGRPIKANAAGTQAMPGGISGGFLVYEETRDGQSDIRLFDLRTRRRSNPPLGVNTSLPEFGPSLSGGWLVFTRFDPTRSLTRVLARHLTSGSGFELFRRTGCPARSWQASGPYVVGTDCGRLFRYDLARRYYMQFLPFAYMRGAGWDMPSVTPDGTVYSVGTHQGKRCHRLLARFVLKGELAAETVLTVAEDVGLGPTDIAVERGEVNLYYTRGVCRANSDIYRISLGTASSP